MRDFGKNDDRNIYDSMDMEFVNVKSQNWDSHAFRTRDNKDEIMMSVDENEESDAKFS